MNLPNPYRPILRFGLAPKLPSISIGYAVQHFVVFLTSFLSSMFLFYSAYRGPVATLKQIREEPSTWAILPVLGVCVWIIHALIVFFSASVRRTGPKLNATVGGTSLVFCILVAQLVSDYGPNSIAIPWSWTPEYICILIYVCGSVIAIVLLVSTKGWLIPIDNIDIHPSTRLGRFDNGTSAPRAR